MTNDHPIQESLFDMGGPDEALGYRVPIACQVAGITYRQLDYWARTKLVSCRHHLPATRLLGPHQTRGT